MKRNSGILLPVFSLPNNYGIGGFGRECYNFIDYLKEAGQSVWQVLPLVETGFGNSPYSSKCSYSFNPYFISLEHLKSDGLITNEELKSQRCNQTYIDYGKLYKERFPLLRKAFLRFDVKDPEFKKFVKSEKYKDYAVFSALKTLKYECGDHTYESLLLRRDQSKISNFIKNNEQEYLFWLFLQYYANSEWEDVKSYAKANGIKILGDLPLYVAYDSVDVWSNPELFCLDQNLIPKKVAGVPPDYFCKEGQLWGNPVYDYSVHRLDGFSWWKNRIKKVLKIYDLVRIDHFRGLDRFYTVNYGSENAMNGEWIDVPSKELFSEIFKVAKKEQIIAEDLGVIDDGVIELLNYTGLSGMKVLSFAFNGDTNNPYLPENTIKNSVYYTGTHDNDTLKGLISSLTESELETLKKGVKNSLKKLKISGNVNTQNQLINTIIKLGFYSKSNTFIMPFGDVIKAGSEKRINSPGFLKEQNWAVRFSKKDFSSSRAEKLRKLTESSGRFNG